MKSLPLAKRIPQLAGYLWAFSGTLLGTVLLSPVHNRLDLSNVALLYVLGVVVIAVSFGRGPAVVTALSGSLCYAYVFVPPHFSLAITEVQYLLAASIMLVVALLVGHLTSRLKQHADFADRKSVESTTLYGLARELAGAPTPAAVIDAVSQFLASALQARQIRVFFSGDCASACGPANPALLKQCAERNEFLSSPTSQGCFYALIPLTAASGIQGVLGFETRSSSLKTQDAIEYIETVASVLAVALERSHFAEKARETEVKHAAEALRSSILSALSHDLRTPLTALVGMAETIALGKASPERQKNMLEAVRNQAVSISQQMTKLLDMARLSVGKIELNTAWQPVEEVLGATMQQVRSHWNEREVLVNVASGLPPVNIDAVLIERVLWNLVENAIKYSPADTPVEIAVRQVGEQMEITVCDAGAGIAAENMLRIFDLFQRGRTESDIPGVGLGLSIARTIVEAHGGAISAGNRESGGSCFCVRLPIEPAPSFAEMDQPA